VTGRDMSSLREVGSSLARNRTRHAQPAFQREWSIFSNCQTAANRTYKPGRGASLVAKVRNFAPELGRRKDCVIALFRYVIPVHNGGPISARPPVVLSTDERAVIAVAKAAAARGEFASDERVRATWAKRGL
jgi:hypothetical protein